MEPPCRIRNKMSHGQSLVSTSKEGEEGRERGGGRGEEGEGRRERGMSLFVLPLCKLIEEVEGFRGLELSQNKR